MVKNIFKKIELKAKNQPVSTAMAMSKTAKLSFVFFLIYIVHLVYNIFTMLSLTDQQLILFKRLTLPLLGFRMDVDLFFISAPLAALFFFVCFQTLLLQKPVPAKENDRDFPSIDKEPPSIDECSFFHRLSKSISRIRRGILRTFIKGTFDFVFYGSLPLFLIFTAAVYLKRHEPILNYLLAAVPVAGTVAVIRIRHLHDSQGTKKTSLQILGRFAWLSIILAFEILLLGFLIPWTQTGVAPRKYMFNLERITKPLIYADMSALNLSASKVKDIDISLRSFDKIHLGGATLNMAVLRHVDLSRTYLRGAKMRFADLEEADLSFADLRETNLLNTNLQNANLFHTNFIGTYALGANFRKANLCGAVFRAARLFLSDFQEADLSDADFREGAPIRVNFQEADLSHCNFEAVIMTQTNFSFANLSYANLRNANLRWAVFEGTILIESDLTGALNLTLEQISKAKTLYKATLDPELHQEIRNKFPHLLEMPLDKE
jgi:uncharacterized protein YjbI with pentapeptide repeats